jgi:transposase
MEKKSKLLLVAIIVAPLLLVGLFTTDVISYNILEKRLMSAREQRWENLTDFERIGVHISRQDMANWQQQVFTRLKPLFTLLIAMIKTGPVLRMDETPVKVMGEEGREDARKSYMWLALGGPPEKTVAWYEYARQQRM